MEYSLKYSFKCIESVSGASYAGSDSRAGINDGAPGKFVLKLRSRCLGPSALKWLAVGPRKLRCKGKDSLHTTTVCKYTYFSYSDGRVCDGVVPGPRAVKTHTRRNNNIGFSDLGLCVMASSADSSSRFISRKKVRTGWFLRA